MTNDTITKQVFTALSTPYSNLFHLTVDADALREQIVVTQPPRAGRVGNAVSVTAGAKYVPGVADLETISSKRLGSHSGDFLNGHFSDESVTAYCSERDEVSLRGVRKDRQEGKLAAAADLLWTEKTRRTVTDTAIERVFDRVTGWVENHNAKVLDRVKQAFTEAALVDSPWKAKKHHNVALAKASYDALAEVVEELQRKLDNARADLFYERKSALLKEIEEGEAWGEYPTDRIAQVYEAVAALTYSARARTPF